MAQTAGFPAPGSLILPQAASDDHLLQLWLHNRRAETVRTYRADLLRFRTWAGKPFAQVTLGDLAAFWDSLGSLGPATRNRILSSVRSLLAFAHRIGYLPFDVGRPFRLPALPNQLAERILSEADVQRMIHLEPKARNRTILTLLYASGVRVRELCDLQWKDLQPQGDGEGQIAVFGKGGKTRFVQMPASVWTALMSLKGCKKTGPVFVSRRKKGREVAKLGPEQVWRVVRKAARRAGIEANVSPHWMRHAHGSHALDRGAPIHLVQATLGHASVATTGKYLHARPKESSSRFLAI
ncbi:MAG: tyrosine-type recombinase/integrase [Acidobacteriota bacterium]|nr:tyrosine-type recombinase/integrase [Acidobacteriota bacterium]